MPDPWLTIIGIGEAGLDGLTTPTLTLLAEAQTIFGGPRQLSLAEAGTRGQPWPIPFSIAPVLARRLTRTVVLASGDPFWYGAGAILSEQLPREEWRAFPNPSTFSLAASSLGWRMENIACLGLHAAPFSRLRPYLASNARLICLLRGAEDVAALAAWLTTQGFGASRLWRLEALGGPRERIFPGVAATWTAEPGIAPVALAIELAGAPGLPRTPGLPDDLFETDGQITKRAIRALTLSSLAPRPGERLWDIGTGSGAIAIEFLLAAPFTHVSALEPNPARAARALRNAESFGVEHRITVIQAQAPETLETLPRPDAIFIGGGASPALLERLWALAPGARLVANAVTLETEALYTGWAAAKGGTLMRVDLAEAKPLGRLTGWEPSRPIVQWNTII